MNITVVLTTDSGESSDCVHTGAACQSDRWVTI